MNKATLHTPGASIWSAVDTIYATGHQPELWPQLLETLADTVSIQPEILDRELMTHLHQAMRLGERLNPQGESSALGTLLDSVQMPFVVINPAHEVVFVSARFSAQRYAGEGFQLDQGHLRLAPDDNTLLAEVFAGARPLAVLGPYADWDIEEALEVLVLRIDTGLVMLLLVDRSQHRTLKIEELKQNAGLTDSESSLVEDLIEDQNYAQLASRRGVTENTIRSQVKQIFAKTGTSRRAELMQQVTSAPQLLQSVVGTFPPSYIAGSAEDRKYHQQLTLADGNQLGFAEFGPDRGLPMLFMHNVSGSRLQMPVPEQALFAQNIRLIVPDRPGIGLSTWRRKFVMSSWVDAISALLDSLQLDTVLLVGHSMGGIYAMACAAQTPARFTGLGLVSTMAELVPDEDLAGMEEDMQKIVQLGVRHPRLARPLLRLSLRATPDSYVDRRIQKLPRCDQALYRSEGFYQMAVAATRENMRRTAEPMIRDFLMLSRAWSFDVADIAMPVQVWHGDNDITSPLSSIQRLAGRLPDASLRVVPGETHMLLNRQWQRIVRSLLSQFCPAQND